jgi:hypothetical protein
MVKFRVVLVIVVVLLVELVTLLEWILIRLKVPIKCSIVSHH